MPVDRPRPYIPLAVRVTVAGRQFAEAFPYGTEESNRYTSLCLAERRISARLAWLMKILGIKKPQLDHDPALILRKFNERTGKYTPDANDPAHLIYREKAEHQQKTTGRKPGALRTVTTKGSDIGLKSKFARLEGKTKPKRKAPIKSRGFPKGGPKQKIQSRGFRK